MSTWKRIIVNDYGPRGVRCMRDTMVTCCLKGLRTKVKYYEYVIMNKWWVWTQEACKFKSGRGSAQNKLMQGWTGWLILDWSPDVEAKDRFRPRGRRQVQVQNWESRSRVEVKHARKGRKQVFWTTKEGFMIQTTTKSVQESTKWEVELVWVID